MSEDKENKNETDSDTSSESSPLSYENHANPFQQVMDLAKPDTLVNSDDEGSEDDDSILVDESVDHQVSSMEGESDKQSTLDEQRQEFAKAMVEQEVNEAVLNEPKSIVIKDNETGEDVEIWFKSLSIRQMINLTRTILELKKKIVMPDEENEDLELDEDKEYTLAELYERGLAQLDALERRTQPWIDMLYAIISANPMNKNITRDWIADNVGITVKDATLETCEGAMIIDMYNEFTDVSPFLRSLVSTTTLT